MADLDRIRRAIAELAGRPRAVRFAEIKRIVDQLGLVGWSVDDRKTKETWMFWVQGELFSVCEHNRGSSHIKPKYVENFLRAMANLGLYEG